MAFVSYSPFFASGLLAPSTPRSSSRPLPSDEDDDDMWPSSPTSPSFDDSMEIDTPRAKSHMPSSVLDPTLLNSERPTSSAGPTGQSNTAFPGQKCPTTPTTTRTLRRRRSSLSQNTSSTVSSLRSPQRAAENALHLQSQLQHARSRSGSVASNKYSSISAVAAATITEPTSNLKSTARMRSGSVGGALRGPPPLQPSNSSTIPPVPALPLPGANVRSRRSAVRRNFTVPGPIAPPPSAPLPALPISQPIASHNMPRSKLLFPTSVGRGGAPWFIETSPTPPPQVHARSATMPINMPPNFSSSGFAGYEFHKQGHAAPIATRPAPVATSARARGLSVSKSALNGDAHRIDEMKEN